MVRAVASPNRNAHVSGHETPRKTPPKKPNKKTKSNKKDLGYKNPTFALNMPRLVMARRLRLFSRRMVQIMLAGFIGIFIVSFIWMWYSNMFSDVGTRMWNGVYKMTETLGLSLENIYLDGQRNVNNKDVMVMLHVYKHQPILEIDLKSMRARLESLGWVKEAEIARQLPNALHISIKERTPFVIWQHKGKVHLVDETGVVIAQGDVGKYWDLPIIVGEEAQLHTSELVRILGNDPATLNMISSATWVGKRRWDVKLDNNIVIKLPEDKPELAWQRLLQLQKEKQLLDRKIAVIDLRIEDKAFITPMVETPAEDGSVAASPAAMAEDAKAASKGTPQGSNHVTTP